MIRRSFAQAAALAGGTPSGSAGEAVTISGVSTDTRTIKPGNLFVPLDVGAKFDGHTFVLEAFAKGASAAMWQRDRKKPPEAAGLPLIEVDDTMEALQRLAHSYLAELPARVIGVTGSNGKTTTKDMIAAVLSTGFRVHKTADNLNTHIGLPLTILQIDETVDMLVLEMGMRGRGEIDLLTQIARPDVAVITMIGEAHLERLGSREEIARAKLEILSGLKPGGLFVCPGDEPLAARLLPEMPHPADMTVVRFGLQPTNDLYPTSIMHEGKGTQYRLNAADELTFTLPVPGEHNVSNALAATAVGRHFGLSFECIAEGLGSFVLTGMRVDLIEAAGGVAVLNDAYNASPSSTRAALRVLDSLAGYKRKLVVLGDMLELGEHEADYHREIGAELDPDRIQHVFTFGRLAKNIAEAAANAYTADTVHAYEDKAALIDHVRKVVRSGDIVLVKGSRGMQLEEVVQALQHQ